MTLAETVLVTGASGGIGEALAWQFAQAGSDLVLVARSEDKLNALAKKIEERHTVRATVIACDLSEEGSVQRLVAKVKAENLTVDVLVNNAGYGLTGAFSELPLEEQLNMLRLNVVALTELTGAFWPNMIDRGRGGVLNVSSLAGFTPTPFLAVYAATKAYVLAFSESLWEEARGTGVKVSCLCPGTTESGFHDRAGTSEVPSGQMARMSAERVARIAYEGFQSDRRVVVPGALNRLTRRLLSLTPPPLLFKAMRKAFGR